MTQSVPSLLVDKTNWSDIKPRLLAEVAEAPFVGFDIETTDADTAHEGIKAFRGNNSSRAFDTNRTTVTGFSLWPEGSEAAYYINLAHADVENRLDFRKEGVVDLLDAKRADAHWICHNAPFELTMMAKSLDYELEDVICTLQMAVSAYGPDEYDTDKLVEHGLGEIHNLLPDVARQFRLYQGDQNNMTSAQSELFLKVIAKESKAKHSWRGIVNDICFGYALKKAVKSHFDYNMTTFDDLMKTYSAKHMGQLTGAQVADYGADDAFWAVKLFRHLMSFMARTNPGVIQTFFEQENPMIYVFADVWRNGMKANPAGIKKYRADERENCAQILRDLRTEMKKLLPFPDQPHQALQEADSWYAKNSEGHRQAIIRWLEQDNSTSDYEQCLQAGGAVGNVWASETGRSKPIGPNFTHYMKIRTVMYDLFEEKLIKSKGKVQSDGESRGRMIDRLSKKENTETKVRVLSLINQLASVDQRMKLYLNPYTLLQDPDTGRMYPVLSSKLASRRMASSNPNGMQLSKRGESTYVRGFYEPDEPDHVMISIDWSQIELVLIGDQSGDPEFARAYGQLPYQDLHTGAAVSGLQVLVPDLTKEFFLEMGRKTEEEIKDLSPKLLTDVNGNPMSAGKAKSYWRTVIGKISNFNYWYSGALSTVGDTLGWTSDQMWEATDRYRSLFSVAEEWRKLQIETLKEKGFLILPDGHRRVRFESTPLWARMMHSMFMAYNNQAITRFGNDVIKAVQSRSGNQGVNSVIQGSCATLAKRSILRINERLKELGWGRFLLPVHDELIFSIHRDHVWDFIVMAKEIMCNHPDIIRNLKIDATASVGLTFEPYHADKAPFGQIELDEAPDVEFVPKEKWGGKLNREETEAVVNHLFKIREAA